MLDAMNSLLATGELATLFTNDEMDGLLQVKLHYQLKLYISVYCISICMSLYVQCVYTCMLFSFDTDHVIDS